VVVVVSAQKQDKGARVMMMVGLFEASETTGAMLPPLFPAKMRAK